MQPDFFSGQKKQHGQGDAGWMEAKSPRANGDFGGMGYGGSHTGYGGQQHQTRAQQQQQCAVQQEAAYKAQIKQQQQRHQLDMQAKQKSAVSQYTPFQDSSVRCRAFVAAIPVPVPRKNCFFCFGTTPPA